MTIQSWWKLFQYIYLCFVVWSSSSLIGFLKLEFPWIISWMPQKFYSIISLNHAYQASLDDSNKEAPLASNNTNRIKQSSKKLNNSNKVAPKASILHPSGPTGLQKGWPYLQSCRSDLFISLAFIHPSFLFIHQSHLLHPLHGWCPRLSIVWNA